jgi:hypothetical protein
MTDHRPALGRAREHPLAVTAETLYETVVLASLPRFGRTIGPARIVLLENSPR